MLKSLSIANLKLEPKPLFHSYSKLTLNLNTPINSLIKSTQIFGKMIKNMNTITILKLISMILSKEELKLSSINLSSSIMDQIQLPLVKKESTESYSLPLSKLCNLKLIQLEELLMILMLNQAEIIENYNKKKLELFSITKMPTLNVLVCSNSHMIQDNKISKTLSKMKMDMLPHTKKL
jgi:hypothetical protein